MGARFYQPPKTEVQKAQEAALLQVLQMLGESLGEIPSDLFPGFDTFGEPYPELTNLQNMSLAGLENMASGISEGTGEVGGGLSEARDVLDRLMRQGFDEDAFDEFFTGAIQDPALQAFNRDVLPQISRGAAGNFFGSERQTSDATARQDLLSSLTSSRAKHAFGERERVQGLAAGAAASRPAFEGGIMGLLTSLLGAGTTEQEFEVNARAARESMHASAMDEIYRRLATIRGTVSVPTKDPVSQPGTASLGPDLIAAGGNILAAAAGQSGEGSIWDWIQNSQNEQKEES